jgi:hypothetical protein
MRFAEDDGHFSVYRQPSMNSNGNARRPPDPLRTQWPTRHLNRT